MKLITDDITDDIRDETTKSVYDHGEILNGFREVGENRLEILFNNFICSIGYRLLDLSEVNELKLVFTFKDRTVVEFLDTKDESSLRKEFRKLLEKMYEFTFDAFELEE
jgi:hypothetical protein